MAWKPGPTAAKYQTAQHRNTRRRLIAAWSPGDPCARCGQPMWGPASAIHLGHNDDGVTYRGLEHAACNVRDGARRGRARQPEQPWVRQWTVCPGCRQAVRPGRRYCSPVCKAAGAAPTGATRLSW